MTFELGIPEISVGVLLIGAVQFLLTLWVSERVKAALQKDNAVFLERLRWEQKAREQSEGVAEYMAVARDLTASSPGDDYRRANRLAWELAMWLPADVYKALGRALRSPNSADNPLSVVVAVREVLLGDALGSLTQDDILHHAPGIGQRQGGQQLSQLGSRPPSGGHPGHPPERRTEGSGQPGGGAGGSRAVSGSGALEDQDGAG